VKDLFARMDELGPGFDLNLVKRPTQFVPDSALISSLLSDLRRTHMHLAIVVDEYGATVGIVTSTTYSRSWSVTSATSSTLTEAARAAIQKLEAGPYVVHGRSCSKNWITSSDRHR